MLWVSVINSFLIFAVNAFVLITGYFSVNLQKEKLVKLIVPVLLYTILFITVPYFIQRDYGDAIRSIFFLSHGPYWFILDYFFLMILSPLLNEGYNKLNKHKSCILIGALLIVNCYFGFLWGDKVNYNGYSLMQFVLMYLIGRHIRVFGLDIKCKWALFFYVTCSLLNGVLFFMTIKYGYEHLTWKITYYNNPLVIASAVFFFTVFLKINISSSLVNYLSSSAIAIYLLQNTPLVGKYYYQTVSEYYINNGNIWMALGLILILSLLICIVSLIVDKICVPITKYACKIICEKLNYNILWK